MLPPAAATSLARHQPARWCQRDLLTGAVPVATKCEWQYRQHTATISAPSGATGSSGGNNNTATDTDTVVGARVAATKTASSAPWLSHGDHSIVLTTLAPTGAQERQSGDELTGCPASTLALASAAA